MYHPAYQSRTTYARNHRAGATRTAILSPAQPGAGILRVTVDGEAKGYTAPVVAIPSQHGGTTVYHVQSENFPNRYYTMFRWPGSGNWYLSDEDEGRTGYAAFKAAYVARVEAFIAAQQDAA
jgi:hypothetical protein